MSAPHPDRLSTLPSEAELIDAESLVSRLRSANTPKLTGLVGNEVDFALNKWRRRDNALSTLSRLIDLARESR